MTKKQKQGNPILDSNLGREFDPRKMRWVQKCVQGAAQVLDFLHEETVDNPEQYAEVSRGIAVALDACAAFMGRELEKGDCASPNGMEARYERAAVRPN